MSVSGFIFAGIAAAGVIVDIQHEEFLSSLPPEIATKIRVEQEESRKEAKKDRQHKELCEALRASGKAKIIHHYSSNASIDSSGYGQGLANGMLFGEIFK